MFGAIEGSGSVALGVVLVAIGAFGASRMPDAGPTVALRVRALVGLVPFGMLIGAGAALVRGDALVPAIVAGAIVVPAVGLGTRLARARRARRVADAGDASD